MVVVIGTPDVVVVSAGRVITVVVIVVPVVDVGTTGVDG